VITGATAAWDTLHMIIAPTSSFQPLASPVQPQPGAINPPSLQVRAMLASSPALLLRSPALHHGIHDSATSSLQQLASPVQPQPGAINPPSLQVRAMLASSPALLLRGPALGVISTSPRASIQNPASGSPSAAWLEDCRDNR